MAQHHLNDETLLDYATGSLGEAPSLLVATHLALAPEAAREVRHYEALGGALLERLEPVAMESPAGAVLARIEAANDDAAPDAAPMAAAGAGLPAPLCAYLPDGLDGVRWRKVGGGISEYVLPIEVARGEKVALLRIEAGRGVPMHTHHGDEWTLVLQGAFEDENGRFGPGDIAITTPDDTHHPVADTDGDCICLTYTEAPLRFKGPLAPLFNFLAR